MDLTSLPEVSSIDVFRSFRVFLEDGLVASVDPPHLLLEDTRLASITDSNHVPLTKAVL